jgi:small subunit ribosomal protein S16
MSLKIRLSRGGAKKRPYYRIVVADSRRARDGRFIERIGSYNPMVAKDHPDRIKLDQDRAKYWLGVGATPSDRVARFLADMDMGERPVIHEQTKKHLPKAKAQERMAEAEAKKAAAEEAAAAAEAPTEAEAAEEATAAEAPAEEAAAEEAPAEEAAAEEAPAEEAAAEEAPAEDEEKKEEA